jgi:hypothetical protein
MMVGWNEWLSGLAGAVLGGGMTLLAAYIANRHSQKLATNERWWQKRFDHYVEAVRAVEDLRDACSNLLDHYEGIPLAAPYVAELEQRRRTAQIQLTGIHGTSHLVFTKTGTEALLQLLAVLLDTDSEPIIFYGAVTDSAKACRDTLIAEAEKQLEIAIRT